MYFLVMNACNVSPDSNIGAKTCRSLGVSAGVLFIARMGVLI